MEQKQDEAVCPTYQTLCLQFLIMALYAVCIKKTKRIKGKKRRKPCLSCIYCGCFELPRIISVCFSHVAAFQFSCLFSNND